MFQYKKAEANGVDEEERGGGYLLSSICQQVLACDCIDHQ